MVRGGELGKRWNSIELTPAAGKLCTAMLKRAWVTDTECHWPYSDNPARRFKGPRCFYFNVSRFHVRDHLCTPLHSALCDSTLTDHFAADFTDRIVWKTWCSVCSYRSVKRRLIRWSFDLPTDRFNLKTDEKSIK